MLLTESTSCVSASSEQYCYCSSSVTSESCLVGHPWFSSNEMKITTVILNDTHMYSKHNGYLVSIWQHSVYEKIQILIIFYSYKLYSCQTQGTVDTFCCWQKLYCCWKQFCKPPLQFTAMCICSFGLPCIWAWNNEHELSPVELAGSKKETTLNTLEELWVSGRVILK